MAQYRQKLILLPNIFMGGKGKRTWWMSLLRIEDWVGNISAESLGSNIPIFKPKGCQILALPERRS